MKLGEVGRILCFQRNKRYAGSPKNIYGEYVVRTDESEN